jgi:hypothetical protein
MKGLPISKQFRNSFRKSDKGCSNLSQVLCVQEIRIFRRKSLMTSEVACGLVPLCKKYITFALGPHSVSHRRRSGIVKLASHLFDGPSTIRVIVATLIRLFNSYFIALPKNEFSSGRSP